MEIINTVLLVLVIVSVLLISWRVRNIGKAIDHGALHGPPGPMGPMGMTGERGPRGLSWHETEGTENDSSH